MSLDNRWVKDIKDKEEKEKVAQRIINTLNSDPTFKKLREILELEIAQIERAYLSTDVYDTPSWAYRQAHSNGQTAALYTLRKLLTHNDQ